MKNIALITNILVLASTSLFAQSHTAATHYNVKKGDTLTRIAQRHNTTVAKIKQVNGMKNDNLSIGQKIALSSCADSSKHAATSSKRSTTPSKHTAKSNETFYSIARQHKIQLSSLIAANPNVHPSKLRTGQVLVIDATAKPAAKSVAKSTPAPAKAKVASTPKPTTQAKLASAPAPAPKAEVKETVNNTPAQSSGSAIRTITVYEQMTYGQFAGKHGASTNQLNALNGLSLSNNTMLAEGSELYVPQY